MVGNGHETSGPGIMRFQDSGRIIQGIRRSGRPLAIHRLSAGR
jgi:hypothetical protein